MTSRTLVSHVFLCIALSAIGNKAAHADLIKITSGNFAANTAFFDSFDKSLGTLDSVDVTLNGLLSLALLPSTNLVPAGNSVVPVPYAVTGQVIESFQGSAFDSSPPGNILSVTGLADGAGGPINVFAPINLDFHFDATTDISGFTSSGSGFLFTGHRSDFALGPFAIPLIETSVANFINTTFLPVQMFTSDLEGAIIVQYNYTPPPPNPTSVAEPSVIALLGIGLCILAIRRRKTFRNRAEREPFRFLSRAAS